MPLATSADGVSKQSSRYQRTHPKWAQGKGGSSVREGAGGRSVGVRPLVSSLASHVVQWGGAPCMVRRGASTYMATPVASTASPTNQASAHHVCKRGMGMPTECDGGVSATRLQWLECPISGVPDSQTGSCNSVLWLGMFK